MKHKKRSVYLLLCICISIFYACRKEEKKPDPITAADIQRSALQFLARQLSPAAYQQLDPANVVIYTLKEPVTAVRIPLKNAGDSIFIQFS